MAAEPVQVPLENGEKEENENENENEQKEKPVEEKSGGKQAEAPPQEKKLIQLQSWPRPQSRPPSQQLQNNHQFQHQDFSSQGENQDRRKSVTFGPSIRKDIPPEIRQPSIQQGVIIRRPSPWAVLRAKLPTGENLPVLRPVISNEHIIQRMQNPEAASRPPSRPPLSRPGSQESVRPPYIQRSDSVVGRPPSSPRPPGPMRPPSRTSTSSKDEEEDVTTNEMKGGQASMGRPQGVQKTQGQPNQMQTAPQSPIIQIASHPQNTQNPLPMINQPVRTQQNTAPSNLQSQTVQQQNQAPVSQMTTIPFKPQAAVPTNQQSGQQSHVQGMASQNPSSQPLLTQQIVNTQQPQQPIQNQHPQNQTPASQASILANSPSMPPAQTQPPVSPANSNQAQPSNSVQSTPPKSTPQVPGQNNVQIIPQNSGSLAPAQISLQSTPNSGSQAQVQNPIQSTPVNTGPQTPSQPSTIQNTVPSSPVGTRRPATTHTSNPIPSTTKNSVVQKQESITSINEENKVTKPMDKAAEMKSTQDKTQLDTAKQQKEKDLSKKLNGLQEKPMHKPPIVVEATLKRPMDLKSPAVTRKAEEVNQTAKDNEPPRPESTPSKAQESAVVNGNHESPKKSKTAPPKKLGTAQSPLKSPNKPLPKTPETPGSADKKKVPMNKVQVGAAPSPNLKSVKSKIGSLENAKHKPGGGHVKIEHRKLNFNVAPKIEAKNDTYTPGGGDKKIQQVKLQWNAKPKVGSLDNAAHKPGGGDKKIESVKLDFKEKAKPKVGSKDNIKHVAGGGTVKIEDQKLEVKAQSKVGSLDNVKYKPGGGEKKIFDDKEYLKQMASTSMDSLNQERKKRSRCNSTSSQDSKYKSDDKLNSRLSLKSEGQKDQPKEKSPQRPTDQNSNQVNDKNTPDSQSKSPKSDEQVSAIQIKTNGLNYQGVSRDANGNGKTQETYKDELRGIETKGKNEIYEQQSSINKQASTISSLMDDKKPPIKPVPQSHQNAGTVQSKEQVPNFNLNDSISITNQSRPVPNMPRPQITHPIQTPQKNISGLPPNVHLAKDLINEASINERIIEKSLTEKPEKESRPLDSTKPTNIK